MARQSFIQTAQENIRKDLFEGCEAQFFRGMQVISTDPGDIRSKVDQALAKTGLCVVVEVMGGPAPIPCDPTDWNARISVVERVPVNRAGRSGKTADLVVDAVHRCFANGGHFVRGDTKPAHENGLTIYVIEGKTLILLEKKADDGGEC